MVVRVVRILPGLGFIGAIRFRRPHPAGRSWHVELAPPARHGTL